MLTPCCHRAKETHQLAAANAEKNRKLKEAFGLADYVDGSCFDPNRVSAKAATAVEMATKKYEYECVVVVCLLLLFVYVCCADVTELRFIMRTVGTC